MESRPPPPPGKKYCILCHYWTAYIAKYKIWYLSGPERTECKNYFCERCKNLVVESRPERVRTVRLIEDFIDIIVKDNVR